MTKLDKEIFKEWGKMFASATIAFLMLLMACVMCGCTKTQYVPVPEYHTETIKTDSMLFQSILQTLRDSERSRQSSYDSLAHIKNKLVVLNEQGDTTKHIETDYVYMSKGERAEYQRAIEVLRDSVRDLKAEKAVIKVDSVPVPYPVEKKLSKWEQTKMDFGGIALGGVAVAVGIIAWLAIRKRRK